MSAPTDADTPSSRFGPACAALVAKLRAERERQGLTQRELGRRIGEYSTSLCNWEKGRSVPGIAAMARWAAGLGLEFSLTRSSGTPDESEPPGTEYGIRADFTDTTSAEFTVADNIGDALEALAEFDARHGDKVLSRELVERPVGEWRKVGGEHG